MAAKGKASKSSSGAAMSKYDVEVEKRLKALEAEAHPKCHHDDDVPKGDLGLVEHRLNLLENKDVADVGELAQRLFVFEETLKRIPSLGFEKMRDRIEAEFNTPTDEEA